MRKHPFRAVLIVAAALAVVGAVAVAWHVRERHSSVYTDADTIRRPTGATSPRDVLWRPARPLDGVVNTAGDEYEPRVTADGHTLLFVRGKAGENADIWWATRTPDGWSDPEPLAAVNTPTDELGPEPSLDGGTLYFYSNRDGGLGGYDLWVTHLVDDAWLPPTNLGPPVNTSHNEYGATITPDGKSLYFASNRPAPDDDEATPDPAAWTATVREDLAQRDYDLYRAAVTPRGVGVPEPVRELNSPFNDGSPALSPAGDFVYLSSDRPGGHGGFDLYRARRLRDTHGDLENLGPSVNTTANELDPGLDLGGFGLHFSTNRNAAGYDLYRTTSREVFLEQTSYRATIDWMAVLPYFIWLLAILLILALLLLLARFLRSRGFQRLSLIARCLLASMLVHLMLMVVLAFWGVSSSLSEWMTEGRGTRVALVTHRGGEDVAAQIRGDLTSTPIEPETTPAERAETAPDLEPDPVPTTEIAVERARIEIEPRTPPATPDDAPVPTVEPEPTSVALTAPETETVDVRVPEAAERADMREAAVPAPASMTAARARTRSAPSEPAPESAVVEVAPAPTEPVPDTDSAPTEITAAGDHAPAVATSATPVTLDVLAARDLPTLPALHETARRGGGETETQVRFATPASRRARTDTTSAPTTAARPVVVNSVSSVLVEPEATISGMPSPDDAPLPAVEASATTVALEAAGQEAVDVRLPEAAERAAAREAPVPAPTSVTVKLARARPAPSEPAPPPAVVRIAPAPTEPVPDPNPAPTEVAAAGDRAPAIATSATPATLDLPETHDLPALPALDEAVRRGGTETTTRVLASSRVSHRAKTDTTSAPTTTARSVVSPVAPIRAVPVTAAGRTPAPGDAPTPAPDAQPWSVALTAPGPETVGVRLPEAAERAATREAAVPAPASVTPTVARARPGMGDPAPPLAAVEVAPAPTQTLPDPVAMPTQATAAGDHPPTVVASATPVMPDLPETRDLPPLPALTDTARHGGAETATRVRAGAIPSHRARADTASASTITARPVSSRIAPARAEFEPETTTGRTPPPDDAPVPPPATGLLARDTPTLPALNATVLPPPMPTATSAAPERAPRIAPKLRPARRTLTSSAPATPAAPVETSPGTTEIVDGAPPALTATEARATDVPATGLLARDTPALPARDAIIALPPMPAQTSAERERAPHIAPERRSSRRALTSTASPASAVPVETLPAATIIVDGAPPALTATEARPTDVVGAERPAPSIRLAPVELALRLPAATPPTRSGPYVQREPEQRERLVEEMGGSTETERAVTLALDWLVRHQADDGRWASTRYDDGCGRCVGAATENVDIATTGLALLCFLGTSNTHVRPGPYRDAVLDGLVWLLAQQAPDGSIMGGESMYSHGIATIALAEAYGLTRDPDLRRPVELAVMHIIGARNRSIGGWRYAPGQVGDTSVLGWQIMALKAARHAGITVPQRGFEEGRKWLRLVASRRRPGLYAYQPRHPVSPAMTAEATFVNQLIGARAEDTGRSAAVDYVLDHPPNWELSANTYYWYYATLAMYQHQGDAWTAWNERVKNELLAHQATDGNKAGSWPVVDQWSRVGGRVYQTAICTLTLEVYYRYLPGFVAE
ncbi:MAG: hypothetical protein GY715_05200 [Planctomycetes bacterium]|nr:hypothetical protein [Planctomycetota bacterium]